MSNSSHWNPCILAFFADLTMHRDCPLDCKVYVGNLGNNGNKTELERAFGYYGPLRSVWVAGNPPGFAFVEFEDARDANDAVRELDGRYATISPKLPNGHVIRFDFLGRWTTWLFMSCLHPQQVVVWFPCSSWTVQWREAFPEPWSSTFMEQAAARRKASEPIGQAKVNSPFCMRVIRKTNTNTSASFPTLTQFP